MATRSEIDLIIVPGHGVCRENRTAPDMAGLDTSWVGIFPGEGPCYVEHTQEGVRLASENPKALLVFSGGQTREDAGRRSGEIGDSSRSSFGARSGSFRGFLW